VMKKVQMKKKLCNDTSKRTKAVNLGEQLLNGVPN
jgi:hypothetical protein